ncbi:Uncharacterised protein [Bordetella ansorpii]|uniref:Uncharacterized protein n=1 Tax=Bordetella ansorpii TaxID=288768 RepID=A0A157SMB7_9BORD|nr:hypothetical protein [Bordetella ansorpii]SAI71535.1 Uncharacterised protein [Bordetella ansorpii]
MQTEDSFFGTLGAFLGGAIRVVVDALQAVFGGLGTALAEFFAGMARALGMGPSVFNFALLLLGLLLLWTALRAFMRRSVIAGIFWLFLGLLLLGGLIGGG